MIASVTAESKTKRHDPPATPPAERPAGEAVKQRLDSLDAYRGLIMVTLAFNGFGIAQTAGNLLKEHPDSGLLKAVKYQFDHVEWTGCGYWDLIQPSFMFMVGVSMAYSYAKRRQLGHSYAAMLGHAAIRSLLLIFLGIFLISNGKDHTEWSLMNVLSQIGLGYTFLFLLWDRPVKVQAIAAAAILVGTWLLYVTYPAAGIPAASGNAEVGVTAEWSEKNLPGIKPAWHKNANVGHAIDVRLLNLLPQSKPFTHNNGGYQTINFIPSLATMLFGLMCGELLRTGLTQQRKLLVLVAAGLGGLIVGRLLHDLGICPLVKRIWTPSWALFSTGWCCLILAGLYGVIDMLHCRRWAFPLVVVGMNSIAIYCMGQLLKSWVGKSFKTHLGDGIFDLCGPAFEPMLKFVTIGMVFWLVCLWMYRQKVFVRI